MEIIDYLLNGHSFWKRWKIRRLIKKGKRSLSDDELRSLLNDIRELKKGFHGIVLFYKNDPMAPSFLGHLNEYIEIPPVEFARRFSLDKAMSIESYLSKLEAYVTKFLTSHYVEKT